MIIKTVTLVQLGFGILVIISSYSCRETASSYQVTRIIKNSTEHAVQLNVFDEGLISQSLEIPAFDADTAMAICHSEMGNLVICSLDWYIENMDSVLVSFNYSRSLTYCANISEPKCSVNGKNIMSLNSNGGYSNPVGRGETFIFEITDEDYDAAIPIE